MRSWRRSFSPEFFDYTLDTFVKFVRDVKSGELVNVEAALSLAEVHFIVELAISNFAVLIIFKPLYSFAFFPEAELGWLAWHVVGAEPVLFTTAPVS